MSKKNPSALGANSTSTDGKANDVSMFPVDCLGPCVRERWPGAALDLA